MARIVCWRRISLKLMMLGILFVGVLLFVFRGRSVVRYVGTADVLVKVSVEDIQSARPLEGVGVNILHPSMGTYKATTDANGKAAFRIKFIAHGTIKPGSEESTMIDLNGWNAIVKRGTESLLSMQLVELEVDGRPIMLSGWPRTLAFKLKVDK
jgi:hypothetical protein